MVLAWVGVGELLSGMLMMHGHGHQMTMADLPMCLIVLAIVLGGAVAALWPILRRARAIKRLGRKYHLTFTLSCESPVPPFEFFYDRMNISLSNRLRGTYKAMSVDIGDFTYGLPNGTDARGERQYTPLTRSYLYVSQLPTSLPDLRIDPEGYLVRKSKLARFQRMKCGKEFFGRWFHVWAVSPKDARPLLSEKRMLMHETWPGLALHVKGTGLLLHAGLEREWSAEQMVKALEFARMWLAEEVPAVAG